MAAYAEIRQIYDRQFGSWIKAPPAPASTQTSNDKEAFVVYIRQHTGSEDVHIELKAPSLVAVFRQQFPTTASLFETKATVSWLIEL